MSPTAIVILLLLAGVVLLIAEMLLPTQGVLGVLGGGAVVASVGMAFWINQWFGLSMMLGLVVAAPFAVTAALNIWPRTPIGKRIVLGKVESPVSAPAVAVGESGQAVSDLRPMGLCDFSGRRIETRADGGIIRAGQDVKVQNIIDGRVIVRAV
ncbi:MAG: hypothetical protein ACREJC_15520 [Tepidisphaeraceae bacterium]